MDRTPVTTAAVTAGLVASAGLLLAAPVLAHGVTRASGEVVRYPVTDPEAHAPEGARARVQAVATAEGRTIVTLDVKGFEPWAQYGAHAHVRPCGDPQADPTGSAAGPHFQHEADPVSPSVDPRYANPENEVWLDFATDRAGEGHAKSVVDWQFSSARQARSVIIHERRTSTDPGKHGTAGRRVACLDVPFHG